MDHRHENCTEEYIHTHSHTHTNGQTHSHPHEHAPGVAADNPRAFLEYMIHHNEHHAEDLVELGNKLSSDSKEKLMASVRTLETANTQLADVLYSI